MPPEGLASIQLKEPPGLSILAKIACRMVRSSWGCLGNKLDARENWRLRNLVDGDPIWSRRPQPNHSENSH